MRKHDQSLAEEEPRSHICWGTSLAVSVVAWRFAAPNIGVGIVRMYYGNY